MPSTSSTTAAAKTVTPSGESSRDRSDNTLAVIPTEVAVIIAPIKSAEGDHIPAGPAKPNATVAQAPRKNGMSTPPSATAVAGPA